MSLSAWYTFVENLERSYAGWDGRFYFERGELTINEEKVNEIAGRIASRLLVAEPLVDEYNGVRFYLNGDDHRPPHLFAWSGNPDQNANFAITNGSNPTCADGQVINSSAFPKAKLKDVKEWFSPSNRGRRVEKLMDYFLKHGEPDWFNLNEIFTEDELKRYKERKGGSLRKAYVKDKKDDELKEFEEIENKIKIVNCDFNDDYTLSLTFADGTRKTFDCKDKIFNNRNKDFRWFKEFQDIQEFKKGKAWSSIVIWNDNCDISAYELYVREK